MDETLQETASGNQEQEARASVIESFINEQAESVHAFSLTPANDRGKFYLDYGQTRENLSHTDWRNAPREPHNPMVAEGETASVIQAILDSAEDRLKEAEMDPEILNLLADESRAGNPLTIAEPFIPDIVENSMVIRARQGVQSDYVPTRELVGKIKAQCRPVPEQELILITVPGLLMTWQLQQRLKDQQNTSIAPGFRPS